MGLKSGGGVLSRWLKGVPPPEWTKRPRAKDDLREQAIALRKDGRSYREIREELGVSKGSLSLWLRDVVLTDEQQNNLIEGGRARSAATNRARSSARRAAAIAAAAEQIPAIAESELFVAGVVAYWCEGAKTKPWRPGDGVDFINSDPDVIVLFLRWLELVGVARDRLSFRVSIHESADVTGATQYWADLVGVDPSTFLSVNLKRHNPRTVRHNVDDGYHGCLVIRVRRSSELYRKIAGWWEGIVKGADRLSTPSGVV